MKCETDNCLRDATHVVSTSAARELHQCSDCADRWRRMIQRGADDISIALMRRDESGDERG